MGKAVANHSAFFEDECNTDEGGDDGDEGASEKSASEEVVGEDFCEKIKHGRELPCL